MSDTAATILVVDDDEFTAELTGMILESSGYDVVIAVGGMDALEKIAGDTSIRMIVSDMNMPFIDGVQLFAELRGQGYNQPFMLLTGDDAAPLRLAHPDIDAVLTKDENLQDALPELVEALLARK
ncbi:MAG: response regulator [Desulfuromonadaceae bacterium]|nr:response regulator [Desulfuromonadaceae bacterium]